MMTSKIYKCYTSNIFIMSKKGLSSVVAIALLLVVSVVSVVGFNNWYQTYSSNLLVEAGNANSFN